MNQIEKNNVYSHSSQDIFPPDIEKNIKKECNNKIVIDFLKTSEISNARVYECTKLILHGTQYHKGQIILLPGSTNESPCFGQIVKLIYSDHECAYFVYRNASSYYDARVDLFIIKLQNNHGMVQADHLADFHPLGLFTHYV